MTIERNILNDRARGCLLAGAAGDALGYPVEFIGSFSRIEANYGEGGIQDFDPSPYWTDSKGKALVSDDTQMTLYTAEALHEAHSHGEPPLPAVRQAYLAWYGGQTGRKVKISYPSRLSSLGEVNRNRAPGNTCISALTAVYTGKNPQNDSKGCGGVMRVAPVGIYGAALGLSPQQTGKLGGDCAELTHLHPLSTYSSAMLAILVQLILQGNVADVEDFRLVAQEALQTVEQIYGEEAPFMDEFFAAITRALKMAEFPLPDHEIIEDYLGGGWVAEETLAIAVFSVLRHFDHIDACLRCAVNHGGDSDSTGAVAGNIIGAIKGFEALPAKYEEGLQFPGLILDHADLLSCITPTNQ